MWNSYCKVILKLLCTRYECFYVMLSYFITNTQYTAEVPIVLSEKLCGKLEH